MMVAIIITKQPSLLAFNRDHSPQVQPSQQRPCLDIVPARALQTQRCLAQRLNVFRNLPSWRSSTLKQPSNLVVCGDPIYRMYHWSCLWHQKYLQATRTGHITQMFPFLLALVPFMNAVFESSPSLIIMHNMLQTPRCYDHNC